MPNDRNVDNSEPENHPIVEREMDIILRLTVKTDVEPNDLVGRVIFSKSVDKSLESVPGVAKVKVFEYGTPRNVR